MAAKPSTVSQTAVNGGSTNDKACGTENQGTLASAKNGTPPHSPGENQGRTNGPFCRYQK